MLQTVKKPLLVLLFMLLLSACVGPNGVTLPVIHPDAAAATPAAQATNPCPPATATTQLLQHDVYGYCLLYPAEYEVMRQAVAYEVAIWAPPATSGHRERLLINVEPASGRTLADATQQFIADYSIPGLPLTVTTDIQIDGELATVIDPVPGQEFSRHLLFVHAGLLYDLTFQPADPTQPAAYAQMEALYTAVTKSFTFIPVAAHSGALGLDWQGQLDASTTTSCQQFQLLRNEAGLLGPCGAATQPVQLTGKHAQEWSNILSLFAPFKRTTPTEQIAFYGSGQMTGDAWQRALTAWVHTTYQELATEHTSAAGSTVLSWWLGEAQARPGQCAHLLVLVYGYAYIRIEPCGGGAPVAQAESWLDTHEMETFDTWLYGREPLYQADNYFAGLGESTMTTAETERLVRWAAAVYTRVAEATPAYGTEATR